MRSSFTAMALAFGIVTMTALPAMALTLKENPFDGDEVGAQAPDESVPGTSSIDEAPGSEPMGILIENKPAEFNPGAQTTVESKSGGEVPGSETGNIIGDLPAPVPAAIAIPNLLPARASANEASGKPTELKPAGLSPPDESKVGLAPPDDTLSAKGAQPPDDTLSALGSTPPDDTLSAKGVQPPDDGLSTLGANPPDDQLSTMGTQPSDDTLSALGSPPPDDQLPGALAIDIDKVGGQPPDDQLPGTSAIDIDKALLGESLDLGAGLPTLPTAMQGGVALPGGNVMPQLGDDGQRPAGVEIGEIKVHLGTQDMNPSAARNQQFAPAIQAMPPSIKPTQGIQGQMAPTARTLQ